MTKAVDKNLQVPLKQQALPNKCFHPTDIFLGFPKEEIEQSIPERFQKIVQLYPDRIAVETINRAVTYSELNAMANRIARAILEQCGKGQEPAALVLENDVPMIASVLGLLTAGKMYVPLDPAFPTLRNAYVLADSEARLVVTNNKNLPLAKELAGNKCALINIDALAPSLSDDNPDLPISPDSLAYILYTSGSTGNPKGIVQNHRNVLHLIMRYTNQARIYSNDRVALLRSFSVHGGTLQAFGALLNGATILPFDLKRQGARELAKWLAREEITVCRFGPTLFRHLVAMLENEDRFPNLRTISFSGEPLYQNDIELCRRYFPEDCLLVNSFGATEVSSCCEQVIATGSQIGPSSVPCGTPTTDMEILLLDDNGNGVALGDVGEIAVKSRYLSLGYWRHPELTHAKFLPDSEGTDERICLTGDLGRMLEDGCLDYIGRKDFRVKVRDYTIEVAEIEAALMALESVKQAVVVSSGNPAEEARLVGYVVPTTKSVVPTANALRHALALRLPDYMIPSTFVTLEVLPLTPNGKIDRQGLPKPNMSRPNLDVLYAPPGTPIEGEIERLWAEVLSLDQVGIHDHFLDLGGHSLAATRIISRVAAKFHFEMPVESLFRSPTIAEMASVITEHEANKLENHVGAMVAPKITRRTTREPTPLSFAQQRLWFLNQLESESAAYSEPKAVRLIGSVNISALHNGLNRLVARHEVLRTTFAVVDGVPEQRIAAARSIEFPVVDLSAQPDAVRDAELKKLLTDAVRHPFDLSRDFMLRALLIRLADQEHVLLLVIHHIAFDRWSTAILWRELAAVYEAVALGRSLTLPELPIQYGDFAMWQRQCLQGAVFDNQLSYWKKHLEGISILRLPTDRPNGSTQSHDGDRRSLKLPAELTQGLKALSRCEGVTLFVTLLVAFQTLLRRYTGQEDIVVGSPVAGRTRPETESLIGFFVNTLVLRADLSGNPTFRELVAKVREVVFGVYANQDLPFEKLVEELQPERSLAHPPLFQVVFALQNVPSEAVALPGLRSTSIEVNNGTAKFDLGLFVVDEDDDLVARIDYDASLFDPPTIARMLSHFQTLLESIAANPNQRIGDLQILTEAEKHQLLVKWNDTKIDYPNDRCIHELFEAQVEASPNAIAVAFQEIQLAYRELNHRANQLAHYLRRAGVGPEVRVGVCMERSVELIVGLLGILKAGGAYVPLDPEYPKERLAFMLHDAQVSLLLTRQRLLDNLVEDRGLKPVLSEIEGIEDGDSRSSILDSRTRGVKDGDPRPSILYPRSKVLSLDVDWETIAQESDENPASQLTPDNLAYVMYTSGSAGKPKGVEITHRGITRLLFGIDYAQLDASQTFLQLAPVSFDASTFEIWGALLHGAKCVLFPGSVPVSKDLGDVLRQHEISTLWLTASLFNAVIDEAPEILLGVRQLLVGGEALSVPHVRRALALLPQTEIINGYGPTESTTFACCYRIPPQLGDLLGSIPIGRPVGNTQVYILDEHLTPVPIGIAGEIYIGGDGLARGYCNSSELTAAKFIRNPFANQHGARLYKTGDRARYLVDGNIEFLGRSDNQVKIRGYRIEPEEIEAVLGQHPEVREVLVIGREDNPGDQQIVAYIVPRERALTSELRGYLRAKLPAYMVPSAFVILDSLPLTSNGKIDRRMLPAPDQRQSELEQPFAAPRTPIEERLAQIWREVLKLEKVGIRDNFFDLGGHSLLATQVISRIRGVFQLEVSLLALFESPTIAGLARSIEDAQPAEQGLQAPPLLAISGERRFRLSFAQQRLWFLDQLEPGKALYNVPRAVRIEGNLDLAALERSVNEIVRRHESLRTTFSIVEEQPVQVVSPSLRVFVSLVELTNRPETEREEEARRLSREEAQRPFNLVRGPLLRVTLLRLGEGNHVLLFTMHHIVSDGWSMEVFDRELSILYEAFSNGRASPLPDLRIQYVDFAQWQRDWLQGKVLETQLAYWKTKLEGLPDVLNLPTDRPRPAVRSFRGAHESCVLSEELSQKLKALSQRENVTLFMTLLAAFQTLLYRYTHQEDIVVGSPIAHRNRTEIEGLIGFFVNTLVLRTDVSGNPSFRELLGRVREMVLGASAHQDLPFEKLVEELQPERSLSYPPLFQVFFNMFNQADSKFDLAGVTTELFSSSDPESKFDLTLYVKDQSAQISFNLVYSIDLFNQARMTCFLQQYRYLLEQIVAAPQKPIQSYSLVIPESRLLLPDPKVALVEPPQELITSMFSSWVKRTPEQPAIMQGEQSWSYNELSERAATLARVLTASGIERGDVVAVQGRRSFGLIASVIGTLLSGGIILLLDHNLPARRKQLMLREARAKKILYVGDKQPDDAWLEKDLISDVLFVDPTRGCAVDVEAGQNLETIGLPELSPDEPAYIFFTSGTTGVPKGVLGRHKSLSHFLKWQRETFTIKVIDRVAQLTNFSFDVVLRDIFLPLISGGALCLPEHAGALNRDDIIAWLEREQISVLHTVPTLAQSWLESGTGSAPLVGLRYVFFAGEPLTETLVRRWRAAFPNSGELVNLYGPTETTLAKCFYRVPCEIPSGVQPVGRSLPETQALVLVENNQLCGINEPGEIALRTPFRSLGYINAPEEQQKGFVQNPFREDKQDLLYFTGDRGRYRPDGTLEILGRLDDQVKIRGVRVEPAEVTTILASHPAVKSCFVTSMENIDGTCLVAYVVASKQEERTSTQLRSYLVERLPAAMIPAFFVFLDSLPLSPNGKVDRNALPAPHQIPPEAEASFVAPRTPDEKLVAEIWVKVLKLERVGIHDNFFDVGGHSLLATQIVSRIRRALQVELPLRSLFEVPTVAGLAERVDEARGKEQGLETLPMLPVSRDNHLPLSFAQQRLWFLDQLEPGSTTYNIPRAVRIKGPLDVASLEQSLNEMVRRHEILRTHFSMVEEQPVQIIAPSLSLSLPVVDLTGNPESEREEEARRLASEDARRPFDLTRGPLVRVVLFRLGREDHLLLLTLHHIVSDGWSMGLLYRELSALYRGFTSAQPSLLPNLPIQYADFAVWQRDWLQSEVLEAQLSYWKKQLKNFSAVINLPTDRPRPPVQSFRGATQSIELSKELTQGLEALSRERDVTLFMTLLAAFQTLLHRYTGQDDIVVGSPIANRNRHEIENLIGFFVNTLVLRSNLTGNPTFRELLARVREVALEAYAHQDIPFEKLVEELHPERNLSYSPLFQVMFVLQNASSRDLELPGLTLDFMQIDSRTAKFDLLLSMSESAGGLKTSLEYSTDLFDAATIERMLSHFRTLLEGIVAHPDQRICNLPILTEIQRDQLLVEWNDTEKDYPKDKCIHRLFEEQVDKSPDAIALVYEDQQLTYRELNGRANQLARYLKQHGVGPEVLVAICVERSLEMMVGLLAVLKAGGAYLPVDPACPKERLAFMVKDAKVSVLLKQERLKAELPEYDGEVICLDSDWEVISEQSEQNLVHDVTAENLVYVIYTSGSTGKPKGVQIRHRAVVNFLTSMREQPGLILEDTFLAVTGLSFDIAALELYLPLIVGARLVLASREVALDGKRLAELVADSAVTVMQATPATWRLLLDVGWRGSAQLKILCGGEALPKELGEELVNRCASLWNLYGPTETTIWSAIYRLGSSDDPVLIGRPISNTQIYILDSQLQPVPVGVRGEIYIGGAGLARAYLNHPELTAEKFIPDPFSNERGMRLYKTGDLARYLPDGIEFLGRLDSEVKIRGFRIGLGEIESVLSQYPGVRETVVVAREDVRGNPSAEFTLSAAEGLTTSKRLVAYVIPAQQPAPTINELRNFLKAKLPDYMIPSAFVFLDSVPLTPNGKVDRMALPAPDQSRPELEESYQVPRTPVEAMIAEIWAEVLKLEKVGIHDNFFNLGGHSLLAVQVVSRIRKTFDVELPLRSMFEGPTIEELAATVVAHQAKAMSQGDAKPLLCEVEALSEEEAERQLIDGSTQLRLAQ